MLMKYKDFKTMSIQEMKEIKGGNAPETYCRQNDCSADSDCTGKQKCGTMSCTDTNGNASSFRMCQSAPVSQ